MLENDVQKLDSNLRDFLSRKRYSLLYLDFLLVNFNSIDHPLFNILIVLSKRTHQSNDGSNSSILKMLILK